jgi:anaerobic dimethyl sulfoxide reductase subunit A
MNWKWQEAVLLREKLDNWRISKRDYHSMIGNPADNPTPNLRLLWFTAFRSIYNTYESVHFNQQQDINRQIEAVKKLEFLVARGLHMMDVSCRVADIVLPLQGGSKYFPLEGSPGFSDMTGGFIYKPRLVEPPGEARPDDWIWTQLAKKLGIGDLYNPTMVDAVTLEEYDAELEELCREEYERWSVEQGIETLWQEFIDDPIFFEDVPVFDRPPYYPFAEQIQYGKPFNTKSGKIEIYSEYLATTDLTETKYGGYISPMPVWEPPEEGIWDPKVKKYPLLVISPHPKHRMHGIAGPNRWMNTDVYRHSVWISTADAKIRGIEDGDLVRVYSDVGEIVIQAYVTSRITPGTVSIYEGAWYNPNKQGVDRGGSPNTVLYAEKPNPSGAWPFAGLVEVEKF